MNLSEVLGMFLGFVLSLMVLSYLLGDNPLFRFAAHLLVGVAAGSIGCIALLQVIWPRLLKPLLFGLPEERLLALPPFLLSLLLLSRAAPRWHGFGGPVLAFLSGVGAATVVGGALSGTLFPQSMATINLFDSQAIQSSGKPLGLALLDGAIFLVGTVSALMYFHYHTRAARPAWLQVLSWPGQLVMAIALGAIFAGVLMASLSALVERLGALLDFLNWVVFPGQ